MRIAVWYTSHRISQTICSAFVSNDEHTVEHIHVSKLLETPLDAYDAHVAYGILRGTADVFRKCDELGLDWFNVDNGYTNPGHFDGNYRVSYRGTQAIYPRDLPLKECLPVQVSGGKHILICPPSQYVCQFFGIDYDAWILKALNDCKRFSSTIREKSDPTPINWEKINFVYTFNSSVGWQAVRKGIPCMSDTLHSVVGSFFNTKSIDETKKVFYSTLTEQLFTWMGKHQFTLDNIREGKAWPLLEQYLSVGTQERR